MMIVQSKTYGLYRPQAALQKRRAEGPLSAEGPEGPAAKRQHLADAECLKLTEASLVKGKGPAAFSLNAAVAGDKGVRKAMEDEHLLCPSLREVLPSLPAAWDYALFGVFDGHGGRHTAHFVKNQLAYEIAQALEQECENADGGAVTDKALKRAVRMACLNLDRRVATEGPGGNDGCTACFALVKGSHIVVCNLGDSMAYLARESRESGELQAIPLQANVHKCWVVSEKERILKTGARVDNGRVNGILDVSRSFGDLPFKKYGVLCVPEFMKFAVTGEDQFVVLGCDGFWGSWSAEDALEFTKDLIDRGKMSDTDLKTTCRTVVRHVIEGLQSQDNVSALILEIPSA